MQHPEVPLFSILSAVLAIVPLTCYWKPRNVAIMSLILWLCLANVINGVNAIVWAGNVRNSIPVWCDITTKLILGASYAVPLAILCVCKHLEAVSSSRKFSYDARDHLHRMIFESLMCFGVPLFFMLLHYIVQEHRYDIFENIGCRPSIYVSAPAIVLIWFPPLLILATALVYASLSLHHFLRRRLTFAAHLQNSNSMFTASRYLRSLGMALTQIMWLIALTSYNFSGSVSNGPRPWTSWADVHGNSSNVAAFHSEDLAPHAKRALFVSWWTLPVSGLILFVFLGLGEDAVSGYKKVWVWFKTTVLRRPVRDKKASFAINSSSRRGLKPLHLLSLKTTLPYSTSNLDSPSNSDPTKSPASLKPHISHLSATLTSPHSECYDHNKAELGSAQRPPQSIHILEPAPSYYPPDVPHHPEIALPITSKRISPPPIIIAPAVPPSPSIPDLDACDTFTLSTFSYYGGSGALSPTSPPPLPTSPALSTFAPEPPLVVEPPSLPPPPRRGPRHVGSSGSVNSGWSVVSGVPEDVAVGSYERRRILGISGGGIFVAVEREEQTDAHV